MRTSALLLFLAVACRPRLGDPSYPDVYAVDDETGESNVLRGDDPWDGVEPRLSFSAFYEGGFTDQLLIDDQQIHYYIYNGSYSQIPTGDRVEGDVADELIVSSSSFWGGGIHLDGRGPADLSSWTRLHAALKSDDEAMEDFELGMVGSTGEGRARIGDYGFVADGEWHVVNIPLADFADQVGLESVTVGLLKISAVAEPETRLLIDDLYLAQDAE